MFSAVSEEEEKPAPYSGSPEPSELRLSLCDGGLGLLLLESGHRTFFISRQDPDLDIGFG